MACLSKIKKPEEAVCSTVGTNGIKRERERERERPCDGPLQTIFYFHKINLNTHVISQCVFLPSEYPHTLRFPCEFHAFHDLFLNVTRPAYFSLCYLVTIRQGFSTISRPRAKFTLGYRLTGCKVINEDYVLKLHGRL
jgi:hypothetical protein